MLSLYLSGFTSRCTPCCFFHIRTGYYEALNNSLTSSSTKLNLNINIIYVAKYLIHLKENLICVSEIKAAV